MLIAPNVDCSRHAVSAHEPTVEDPHGYHPLIGGSVNLGEKHRDAMVREVREELGARVHDLTFLGVEESIFRRNGEPAHNVVFLYTGRLDPMPPATHAVLTEDDGSTVPVVWRSFYDEEERLPLYPHEAVPWVLMASRPRAHLPAVQRTRRGTIGRFDEGGENASR
jgi:ADP-ribose pyrophosphatase YjhB (NUDIX family)